MQIGWRRGFWLAVSAGTCTVAAALIPLPAGATAMRLALVAAAVAVALVLARTIRREAAAHRRAAARAELERALATEANHRIKNNLQTVADLLLLGRPDERRRPGLRRDRRADPLDRDGAQAARRDRGPGRRQARSPAQHRRRRPVPVAVDAEPVAFDAATAQKLGIVANELITNAFQHGAPPIVVRLQRRPADAPACRRPRRSAPSASPASASQLVRRMVEQGLGGRFELAARAGGGTRAEVVFPTEPR